MKASLGVGLDLKGFHIGNRYIACRDLDIARYQFDIIHFHRIQATAEVQQVCEQTLSGKQCVSNADGISTSDLELQAQRGQHLNGQQAPKTTLESDGGTSTSDLEIQARCGKYLSG